MAMALGRFVEEEYKPNLHKLGQQIKGQRGLLFSNKPVEEVLRYVMLMSILLRPYFLSSYFHSFKNSLYFMFFIKGCRNRVFEIIILIFLVCLCLFKSHIYYINLKPEI